MCIFVVLVCLFIHLCLFIYLQCIDAARDLLDTELTARAGESYNRAYGVRCCALLWFSKEYVEMTLIGTLWICYSFEVSSDYNAFRAYNVFIWACRSYSACFIDSLKIRAYQTSE